MKSIEDMKFEIEKMRHTNPLVKAAFDSANFKGLSESEMYVILSYHAIKQCSKYEEHLLELSDKDLQQYLIQKTGN